MAISFKPKELRDFLDDTMEDLRASGVSSIADFSIAFHLPTLAFLSSSGYGIISFTPYFLLTFHLSRGTADQECYTVYEVAKDPHSPPYHRFADYHHAHDMSFTEPDSSPRLVASAIEDENALSSALVSSLADWCIEAARKSLAHK